MTCTNLTAPLRPGLHWEVQTAVHRLSAPSIQWSQMEKDTSMCSADVAKMGV